MENRFQNIIDNGNSLGINKFSNVVTPTQNRFQGFIDQTPQQDGFFTRTEKSLGGVVGAVGRLLQTGQFAQVGATEKALEATGVLKDTGIQGTGIAEGIQKGKSNIELLKRIGQETGQGGLLTGQYTPTTSVFGNFIRELPVTSIGLAGDIFLDPTLWIGKLGAVKTGTEAIGKGISTGAKYVAEEIPAVQKVGEMLGKAFTSSNMKIFGVPNAFVERSGQRAEFAAADIERKIQESLATENAGKLVSDIIEKPQFIQQRVAQVIKGGITTDNEVKILAEPIRQELDRVGESIAKLNPKLLSEETFAANKGTYFPRLYTNYEFPAEEKAVDQFFKQRAVSTPRGRFQGRTLTEAEALAKPELIKEAGYPALKGLTQLGITEQRQKFFKEVAKMASDEPRPNWIQLSEDKALGDLAGKFLPAAEYNAIAGIRHVPTGIEELYMKALTTWKTFKTAYSPATIARNDLTNFLVLNPLGGVGPHRLDIYAKTANELMTQGHYYQLARQEGMNISTQQAAELKQLATRFYSENKGLVGEFFKNARSFHTMVSNFYGSQDKFFKLANFIKGVSEDGLTPTQAMRRANFYLVDYSEVPELISWLRKSPIGVPFISFTYGVSKPLAKTLLERPDKLANYFKIISAVQQMNPLGETPQEIQKETVVLPGWIQTGTTLRLPFKDEFGRGQYVNLQYILPFNILETNGLLPSSPALTIMSSLLQNRNSFTGKDLTIPTDTSVEKTQKYGLYVLQQLLPSLAPFGYSFDKIVALLQKRPDANGYVRNAMQVFLDVLGGIKITPIDYTVEAQKRAYEKEKELKELHSQLLKIYLDKTIFPEEKQKEAQQIQEKMNKVFTP